MSLKITTLLANPTSILEDQSQSTVISAPDLFDFYQKKIEPLCRHNYHLEDAVEPIHRLDVPFKYQLLTLGVQKYLNENHPLTTTEKIVKLLVDKGYLYHASLLASSQEDYSTLLEPICTPVFNTLEKYGKCTGELESLKKNMSNINSDIEEIAKVHFNEALALLPFVSSSNEFSYSKFSYLKAVKNLADAGRVDEARAVISQLPDEDFRKGMASLYIITALAKLGDIQGALRLIPELEEECDQDQARVAILAALTDSVRFSL